MDRAKQFTKKEIELKYKEVMAQLKKWGTEQGVKIYRKHGGKGKIYGVSFANLYKLQKKIKINHELAIKLWESRNLDAQVFATLIADPQKMKATQANTWVKDDNFNMLGGHIATVVAKTSFAKKKMEQWMKSKDEYICACGYATFSNMLKNGADLSNENCKNYLKTIEKEIHDSPNRTRYSMNNAVIAIGTYRLEKEAIAAAKKIGKVEVDHGDTSCKTPEAVSYIKKSVQKRKEKEKKAKEKAKTAKKSTEAAKNDKPKKKK